jgi:hypothetical protein
MKEYQKMIHLHKQSNSRNGKFARNIFLLMLLLLFGTPILTHAQNPPTGTVHSVVLTWQAPSPVGGSGTVAGYNVYRATTGVNYAKVNSALITGLTMTDAAVVSGTTYGYCATTVDSVGSESPCTIPVNAAVPGNPASPTNFGATAH